MKKTLLLKTALAVALASPLLASAESQSVTGAGDAVAKLDFRVTIPRVLFLAVGTGSAGLATSGTVDRLDFEYTAGADVGTGTDTNQQSVNVRVRGNNGQIAVAAAGSGTGLVSTTTPTDIIPWTEILVTSDDATNFPVPAVGASANPLLNGASKVTTRATTWKYAYSNTDLVASGIYTGTITYTATMP